MKKFLKWLGIVFGGLTGLLIVTATVVFIVSSIRINKTYDVSLVDIPIPNNTESLAHGEHVANVRLCTGCHGPNLGGDSFIENPRLGYYYASNLTAGEGGVLNDYNDAQLVRAIRHGIGYDNKPLLLMPAHEFYVLSDADVGALIAYIHSQPPVDNVLPESRVGPVSRALLLTGQFPLIPAELIDHNAPRPVSPEPGATVEYGEYLAIICQSCHQTDFAGGRVPGASLEVPAAANLTPAGELASWTEADFITTLRTGVNPRGHKLSSFMLGPDFFADWSDEELKALWLFLQSLPPKEQAE